MDAERFPITTAYGLVPGYPINNGWHRGEDRAMPMDTPVLVNGIQIGLSGNTGSATTGPHLHIGKFVGGGDVNPSRGGFNFIDARVTEVGEDKTNGKYVRVQGDGASWVYLHLSRVTVNVGQVLVRPPNSTPLSAPYRVEDIPTKEIVLNKDTYLWNMVYRSFDEIASHPVAGYPVRYKQTTAAICHHDSGESYYMVGNNDTTGFNVKDCDDYVAPVPAPYVPPKAPERIPLVRRQAIEWGVPTYATAMDAKMKQNPLDYKLVPKSYIILESDDKAYNLTADNRRDGHWINIDEDKPPVVVTPPVPPKIITTIQEAAAKIPPTVDDSWKSSIASFHLDDRSPEFFWATNTSPMVIKDLEGKREDIVMTPYNSDAKGVPRRMPVIATLEKDGILYGWPEQAYKSHIYYCVPLFVLRADKGGVFDDVTDWMERVVTHTMRLSDHPKLAWYKFTKFVDGIKQTQPGKD